MELSATAGLLYNFAVVSEPDSDVALMLGVQAGDEACFERLLARYRTPLLTFLYRMVRDAQLAEDLAQETFLRVYRARGEYRPEAKFSTWLFRIAANLALNALRDHHRRSRWMDRTTELAPTAEISDGAPSAEQVLIRQDHARLVWQAVHSLPEKQRLAVLLHKYEELEYAEIARILGCSESALKSLLFRAYETLRVRLAPLLNGSPAHRTEKERR